MVRLLKSFSKSIWFFPTLLTIALIILTGLKIHGSSIGTYHTFFYGSSTDDSLLLNKPQGIRSDEWLVNTQFTLAQSNNNFEKINSNLGNGQDMSLMVDVPYRDWSVVFKPDNLVFFVLPFENAFAFKWWSLAYLLILSCYFFILLLLPKKRLLASLLSLGFLFSPFLQWWYLYGTLASIYYCLFGVVVVAKILQANRLRYAIAWAALLTYIVACLAFILYPPFQIPCAIAAAAFLTGYLLEKRSSIPLRTLVKRLCIIAVSVFLAALITLAYLGSSHQTVETIRNTAYPGARVVKSGGFDVAHLLSSQLQAQLQFNSKAGFYSMPEAGLTNQSENSNFILLFPLLTPLAIYAIVRRKKERKGYDWPLILVSSTILCLVAWMTIPGLDLFGRVTLLSVVPHARLLIGLGLLNFIFLILLIRATSALKKPVVSTSGAIIYALLVFIIELLLGVYAMERFPGFIGIFRITALAIPLALVTFLLLKRYFVWMAVTLLLFGIGSTFRVNPLYVGLDIVTENPLSRAIRDIQDHDDSKWATDVFLLENFALMNGAPSISGVYTYPQLELWKKADPTADESIYNRYAHTNFTFDRDTTREVSTTLSLIGGDNMNIKTEVCGAFLRTQDVSYIVTATPLDTGDACALPVTVLEYPQITLYVYRLTN